MLWLWLVTSLAVYASLDAEYVGDYDPRYGMYMGSFNNLMHGVSGKIYAMHNTSMFVANFNYDGEAPDAYFFAGNKGTKPSNRGFIFDHKGCRGSYCRTPDPLGPSRNAAFIIDFPTTKKGQRSFNDIKWISVWCKKFAVDFGHVVIHKGVPIPNPVDLGPMIGNQNSVYASNVRMEDTDTVTFEDLKVDPSIKDAVIIIATDDKREYELLEDRKHSSRSYKSARKAPMRVKIPRQAAGAHFKYVAVVSRTKGMLSQMPLPKTMMLPPSVH